MKLVVASNNPGKLREMRELLAPYGVEAVSAGELGLAEPEETGDSFIANALIKARAAAGTDQWSAEPLGNTALPTPGRTPRTSTDLTDSTAPGRRVRRNRFRLNPSRRNP